MLLHRSDLNISETFRQTFSHFSANFFKDSLFLNSFHWFLLRFWWNFIGISVIWNFEFSSENSWILKEFWPNSDVKSSNGSIPRRSNLSTQVERDPSHNARLMDSKVQGTVPWSDTYLRFRWGEIIIIPQENSEMPVRGDAHFSRSYRGWTPHKIVSHMAANPNRAYFSDLFRFGGFKSGVEVGVAAGRFSEHFLLHGRPEPKLALTPS